MPPRRRPSARLRDCLIAPCVLMPHHFAHSEKKSAGPRPALFTSSNQPTGTRTQSQASDRKRGRRRRTPDKNTQGCLGIVSGVVGGRLLGGKTQLGVRRIPPSHVRADTLAWRLYSFGASLSRTPERRRFLRRAAAKLQLFLRPRPSVRPPPHPHLRHLRHSRLRTKACWHSLTRSLRHENQQLRRGERSLRRTRIPDVPPNVLIWLCVPSETTTLRGASRPTGWGKLLLGGRRPGLPSKRRQSESYGWESSAGSANRRSIDGGRPSRSAPDINNSWLPTPNIGTVSAVLLCTTHLRWAEKNLVTTANKVLVFMFR